VVAVLQGRGLVCDRRVGGGLDEELWLVEDLDSVHGRGRGLAGPGKEVEVVKVVELMAEGGYTTGGSRARRLGG
jgi:hypothetical protein